MKLKGSSLTPQKAGIGCYSKPWLCTKEILNGPTTLNVMLKRNVRTITCIFVEANGNAVKICK